MCNYFVAMVTVMYNVSEANFLMSIVQLATCNCSVASLLASSLTKAVNQCRTQRHSSPHISEVLLESRRKHESFKKEIHIYGTMAKMKAKVVV